MTPASETPTAQSSHGASLPMSGAQSDALLALMIMLELKEEQAPARVVVLATVHRTESHATSGALIPCELPLEIDLHFEASPTDSELACANVIVIV